jgi:hypothetical protein
LQKRRVRLLVFKNLLLEPEKSSQGEEGGRSFRTPTSCSVINGLLLPSTVTAGSGEMIFSILLHTTRFMHISRWLSI